jgi:hypothetical protein
MADLPMKRYAYPVTPLEDSQSIGILCGEITPGTPEYVNVVPIEGAPINECFKLVEHQVQIAGGARILGWSLWEMPGVFVEAEAHAVWRSPTGHLIDITPKSRPTQCVLFLPDPRLVYSGLAIDNIRKPVSKSPIVAEFLRMFSVDFEFMNRGERATMYGELELSEEDQIEFQNIKRQMLTLASQARSFYPHHGPYMPCWCGSGRKMRWCHGTP